LLFWVADVIATNSLVIIVIDQASVSTSAFASHRANGHPHFLAPVVG